MRLFLTGVQGQVGQELAREVAPLGELKTFTRNELDLLDLGRLRRQIAAAGPDVILNAAAYTAVDKAETERAQAFAINATAPGVMAEEARRLGALLVHFSTDYVFDGEKHAPYSEADEPRPISVYGESKLAGERAIAASGCRHLILRTSWVYGPRGRNFLLSILAAARDGRSLRVVNDQHGAPTSSAAISRAVAQILVRDDISTLQGGLYHLSAAGATTWHGFAGALLEAFGMPQAVTPIASGEYPAAARRPRNSLLDNTRLRERFGVVLPDWRDGLAMVASTADRQSLK